MNVFLLLILILLNNISAKPQAFQELLNQTKGADKDKNIHEFNPDDEPTKPWRMSWPTDYLTCMKCYDPGQVKRLNPAIHCVDNDFDKSECCNHPADSQKQIQCTSKYAYCTTGLNQNAYKVFTCPQHNCPLHMSYKHSYYDQPINRTIKWNQENKSFNCKTIFKANSNLNGKIVVNITQITNANVYVYRMPNNFQNSHQTHGIIENNQITAILADKDKKKNQKRQKVQPQTEEEEEPKFIPRIFEAPTDWTIYLIYNKYNEAGSIQLQSQVRRYTEEDVSKLESVWKPTETTFVPSKTIQKEEPGNLGQKMPNRNEENENDDVTQQVQFMNNESQQNHEISVFYIVIVVIITLILIFGIIFLKLILTKKKKRSTHQGGKNTHTYMSKSETSSNTCTTETKNNLAPGAEDVISQSGSSNLDSLGYNSIKSPLQNISIHGSIQTSKTNKTAKLSKLPMEIVQEDVSISLELEIKETKSAGIIPRDINLAKQQLTTQTQETFSDVDIIEAEEVNVQFKDIKQKLEGNKNINV